MSSTIRLRAGLILLGLIGLNQLVRAETPNLVGTMPEDAIPALKSIMETAVKQSPTMITRAISIELAETSIYSSRSALLPNASGSFSYGSTTVYPELGDANRSNGLYYNFGVTQPVYQWNALKNQHEISKIGLKISQKNFADGYRSLLGTLRSQFMQLIYRKMVLRTQRYNLTLTRKFLAVDETRFNAGELSAAQMIVPRMNAADAELAMSRSEGDYSHQKRTFMRLAGIDSLPEESIPLEIPRWAGSSDLVDAVLSLFRRDGIDMTLQGQINALSLKQDALNYKIAAVRLYPKVSASAGVSQSNNQVVTPTFVSQSASKSWNYNVAANWTIFDGYAARGSKLAALAAKRTHENERNQMTATMQEEVKNLARMIDSSAQYLALVEQRRKGDADALSLVQTELARGQVSEGAVETALARLYVQEGNVALARFDLINLWTELVSTLNLDPMLANVPPAYVH